jgi:hypothetical protein
MLFPSKVISYNESILPKLPLVLHYLENGPKKISDVYRYTKGKVTDLSDLFEVLDCLYALGMIDLNGDSLLRIGKEDAE